MLQLQSLQAVALFEPAISSGTCVLELEFDLLHVVFDQELLLDDEELIDKLPQSALPAAHGTLELFLGLLSFSLSKPVVLGHFVVIIFIVLHWTPIRHHEADGARLVLTRSSCW